MQPRSAEVELNTRVRMQTAGRSHMVFNMRVRDRQDWRLKDRNTFARPFIQQHTLQSLLEVPEPAKARSAWRFMNALDESPILQAL